MKLPLKWLTPIVLQLLSLSQVSFAQEFLHNDLPSVHLVTGFYVGLAAHSQPRAGAATAATGFSLDADTTNVKLASHEFDFQIMPLHLLGKKSWNVYNQDNIARVKRDEAAARAREEAEDERTQQIDSERRLAILRGEQPVEPFPIAPSSSPSHGDRPHGEGHGRERKKRKRADENDTDYELRLARERAMGPGHSRPAPIAASTSASLTTTSTSQHHALYPPPPIPAIPIPAPTPSTTAAAPNPSQLTRGPRPWYSSQPTQGETRETQEVEEDSKARAKRARDAARVVASDPLVVMRRGAAGVREMRGEREKWAREREREVEGGRDWDSEEGRRKKRRREEDREDHGGDLECFRLDGGEINTGTKREREKGGEKNRDGRHHRHHRHRHHHHKYGDDHDRKHRH